MSRTSEIKESVLAPGNLVFGCSLREIRSYLEQGIRPASVVGSKSLETPDNLCFALLSDKPLPARYNEAFHYAPGGVLGGYSLGIVVSREGLLAKFPEQTYAIGEYFWRREHSEKRKRYNYDPRNKTVHGIPIKEPWGLLFADEVRVYPKDVQSAAVTSDIWTGLIIERFYLQHLPIFFKDYEVTQQLPVLSPRCGLLARDLSRVVRK
jgi:hypothetical protein